MKTKSYKIYNSNEGFISLSESKDGDKIIISIPNNNGRINLNDKQWGELCDLRYDLRVNGDEDQTLSQVPYKVMTPDDANELIDKARADATTKTVFANVDDDIELPQADKTINKLRSGIR